MSTFSKGTSSSQRDSKERIYWVKMIRNLPSANSFGQTSKVSLTVNGTNVEKEVSVRMLLSDFIRHELGLTGTHVGCEHGICGACTVIIDGKSSRSCTLLAVQADGIDLRTIESVANKDGSLHPIQEAFHECHALQCGYCTPGFIMNIVSEFENNEKIDTTDEGIRELIAGNLCRCTGYANIIEAVRDAAEKLQKKR